MAAVPPLPAPAPVPQPAVEAAPPSPAPPAASADQPAPAAKAGAAKAAATPQEELCALIETAATAQNLPIDFFTRLIWKESRFRADAVSPKGAQGIAQFMPGTAAERGLLDPFDPAAAIPASANLLADLSARFGNLGLAAAAYNAGAQRVADWLADGGALPWETQDYVLAITGVAAETWAAPAEAAVPPADAAAPQTCLELAVILKIRVPSPGPRVETAAGPWGVQVAGNFSRARAVAAYAALQKQFPALVGKHPPMIISGRLRGRGTRAFYKVRVPMQSRDEADQFCAELRAAGGSCVVLKT
ncbi:MAG: lytic transglycosylase domain-containing protein [Rhizobiales bacterium]|nr:lytic transglycosylase domain-containing protein [Hyphomicrobiales bacterium]